MKKYSLYLFDFDGTLFDTLDSLKEVYRLTFEKYGIKCKKNEYALFLGLSLPRTAQYKGLDKSKEKEFIDTFHSLAHTQEVVDKTNLYFDTIMCIRYMNERHIKYGVVTGSATERVKSVFEHFKLDVKYLSTIVGNDRYTHPKPDAEPALIALKETGFINKKDEVLFIGDAEQDILCAEAAGIDSVMVKRENNNGTMDSLLDLFKD